MSNDLDSLLEVNTSVKTVSQPQSDSGTGETSSGGHPAFASSVMTRYRDAYLVAKVTTGFGSVIKGIGILLAIVIFGGAATLAGQPQVYGDTKAVYTITGIIFAIIVGSIFYLFGILVSAQGQILKASLDGAVNSSPFISNDQKAQVMSLR